jgi:two-component system LytT family response regulator
MIRAIIVDDEDHSRSALSNTLIRLGSVELVGSTGDIDEAEMLISKLQPDLLFLDIEIPGRNGFDLLESLGRQKFDVIFTTAYEQYALKAIKASAIDYLMKPVGMEELAIAIQKHFTKKHGDINRQVDVLLQHYSGANNRRSMLALPTQSALEMVPISDIIHLQADGGYTRFHLLDNKSLLVSKNIKEYEEVLAEHSFMRIHHSHIVNLRCIKKYTRGEGGTVTLTDSTTAEVSRQKKHDLINSLKAL